MAFLVRRGAVAAPAASRTGKGSRRRHNCAPNRTWDASERPSCRLEVRTPACRPAPRSLRQAPLERLDLGPEEPPIPLALRELPLDRDLPGKHLGLALPLEDAELEVELPLLLGRAGLLEDADARRRPLGAIEEALRDLVLGREEELRSRGA